MAPKVDLQAIPEPRRTARRDGRPGFPLRMFASAWAIALASAFSAHARGAIVPWISYEAEDGVVRGGAYVAGPGRKLGTPEGEASGRKAVMLKQTGASIEWIATSPANSIVIRNSIPDAPNGGGLDATLSLYVNGQKKASLKLSSVHSWLYGDDANQTDNPSAGPARKIYDESNLLFNGFSIAKGDVVQLKKDAEDGAAWYAIDFADLEQVAPPLAKPDGFVSITDAGPSWAGAIAGDNIADDNAIDQCIRAVQAGKYQGVYIPAGTFLQTNKIMAKGAKIQGAGMWYSKLYCPNKGEDAGWGQTGFQITGDGAEFRDFAIFGWGGTRTQGGKAWVNSAHKGTIIERMWVESVQCAYWVGGSDESTGLLVKDCRFRNTGADGVNLCNGNLNSIIDNCHARNTGDDAFAIWSARDLYGQPCRNNVIRNCTVQVTWRAACFAIYGGTGNRIENCVGSDALTYPGLTVSSEFNPFPLVSATVDGLTLFRCGATYWGGQQFGAVWLYSADNSFSGVTIRNLDVVEPTYQGIHLQSKSFPMDNVLIENVTITNPTTFGLQIKSGSMGSAMFRNVTVQTTPSIPVMVNQATAFTATMEKVAAGPTAIGPGTVLRNPRPAKNEGEDYLVNGRKFALAKKGAASAARSVVLENAIR
ncbi:MAG: hypothetical protein JWO30_753 [Fibrobacteres bacterium]|nr:hypothetical protein [Fibrobacterota bacterium]